MKLEGEQLEGLKDYLREIFLGVRVPDEILLRREKTKKKLADLAREWQLENPTRLPATKTA